MVISNKWCIGALVFAFAGMAQAESFSALTQQGYSVGKLTKGKAGNYGYAVSNGRQRFFCRLNAATAYVGKDKMIGLSTSGRLISLDRATFEATIGGHDPSIPQWSDLQAGRVKAANVGSCAVLR